MRRDGVGVCGHWHDVGVVIYVGGTVSTIPWRMSLCGVWVQAAGLLREAVLNGLIHKPSSKTFPFL